MDKFREMVRGWLGYTLLAILLVPFAFVGVESYFSGGKRENAVAKVNGDDISKREFDRIVDQQRQQMLKSMGPDADASQLDMTKLKQQVLDALVDRQLQGQLAERLHMQVSNDMIYQMVSQVPAFQEDGKFSQERFQRLLDQRGMTIKDLQDAIRLQQFNVGLASGFLTNQDVSRLFALDGQKRDVGYILVPTASFLKDVAVSDADIKSYYDSHQKEFTTEDKAKVDYIELKQQDFVNQVQVGKEDLDKAYADRVHELAGAANEKRRASHILIKVDEKTSDTQALAKIRDIEKRVHAGEDFAKLARENSQDPGSVASGGDLDFAGRGQFVPEFEKVLFSLKQGEVSAPVKTQFGYHLIKLTQIQQPEMPSLESIKAQLTDEVKAQKATQLFNDKINEMSDSVYESADLKDPAAKFKLDIHQTDMFTVKAGAGIATVKKVRDTAFSDDLIKDNKNSSAVELVKGDVVWLHVAQHDASHLRALADVSAEVKATLQQQGAKKHAQEAADKIAKEIAAGQQPAAVASAHGLVWEEHKGLTRTTPLPNPLMLQAAYWLPRPAAGKMSADSVDTGNGYAVMTLSQVIDAATPNVPSDKKQMLQMMAQSQSGQELMDFVQSLKSKAKIEKMAQTKDKETEPSSGS